MVEQTKSWIRPNQESVRRQHLPMLHRVSTVNHQNHQTSCCRLRRVYHHLPRYFLMNDLLQVSAKIRTPIPPEGAQGLLRCNGYGKRVRKKRQKMSVLINQAVSRIAEQECWGTLRKGASPQRGGSIQSEASTNISSGNLSYPRSLRIASMRAINNGFPGSLVIMMMFSLSVRCTILILCRSTKLKLSS